MHDMHFMLVRELLEVLGSVEDKNLSICYIGEDKIHSYKIMDMIFTERKIAQRPNSIVEFFELLGFSRVAHINPAVTNLNEIVKIEEQCDIVYNCSASSNVFDQYTFFKNMHDLGTDNCFLMSSVPYYKGNDSTLYNYQPNYFAKMSQANNYACCGAWIAQTDLGGANTYLGSQPRGEFIKVQLKLDFSGLFYLDATNCADWERPAHINVILRKNSKGNFRGYV